ncbi:hypothetical protein [Scytonema sp. PCC 10023]|uniref:hypothetical protein n=1 Tax=Scytonema sp. PCC 10023 TaxID=1680591 RepID=UPI0039C71BBE
MASRSGSVAIISVDRTQCIVLLNDPSNTSPIPTIAILWNSNQGISSSELILRSMWLSLATKSLEEKLQVNIEVDDNSGLAVSVALTFIQVAESSISLPTTEQQRADLVQQLLNQRKQSSVESPSTVP